MEPAYGAPRDPRGADWRDRRLPSDTRIHTEEAAGRILAALRELRERDRRSCRGLAPARRSGQVKGRRDG
jgi:hypothetical protein